MDVVLHAMVSQGQMHTGTKIILRVKLVRCEAVDSIGGSGNLDSMDLV